MVNGEDVSSTMQGCGLIFAGYIIRKTLCNLTAKCLVFIFNMTQPELKPTGSHISAVIYAVLQQRSAELMHRRSQQLSKWLR